MGHGVGVDGIGDWGSKVGDFFGGASVAGGIVDEIVEEVVGRRMFFLFAVGVSGGELVVVVA